MRSGGRKSRIFQIDRAVPKKAFAVSGALGHEEIRIALDMGNGGRDADDE